MSTLHILADENIPLVEEAFGKLGAVERVPAQAITATKVRPVDVLLVRSVTRVGPALLEGSAVRFVGSATIGTDHINHEYLAAEGISFAHAPASNADSVVDYVVAALIVLARRCAGPLTDRTVGIIGCGNIGSRVGRRLAALGLSVRRNDPLRAEAAEAAGRQHDFVSLDTVLDTADTITLHVPLTVEGAHPTYHLIDDDTLDRMQPDMWLVNTSRGSVVDGAALLDALTTGTVGCAVLDVWEHEPTPDEALVRAASLATPHIAGYAFDGKVRGTMMLYEALCGHLGVDGTWDSATALRPAEPGVLRCHPPDPRLPRTEWLHQLTRQAYDVQADDTDLRRLLSMPPGDRGAYFRHLRSTYPRRRELQMHTISPTGIPDSYRRAVAEGLTIQSESQWRHAMRSGPD